jgi:hypothetical protein
MKSGPQHAAYWMPEQTSPNPPNGESSQNYGCSSDYARLILIFVD